MSYAVLMAYVDANSMPEQRVRLAASLAEKFNATLIGLSAFAIHPPFLIEGVAIQQATPADIVEIMANWVTAWIKRRIWLRARPRFRHGI